jgi:CheY-like chemotaxis protein
MNNIIELLTGFEENAARLYDKAALKFKDDRVLFKFLSTLADDERTHRDYLVKASGLLSKRIPGNAVAIDSSTIERVKEVLKAQERILNGEKLSKAALFDFIVANEFSEWNDLFLYAVNVAKNDCAEFIPAIVTTQKHKRFIERFIESQPDLRAQLKTLKGLTTVWEEKILIVDDEETVADALEAIVEDEGLVERASNGKKALEMIGRKYYAVIITDIDMPVMNGLDFYREAVRRFPGIKERLLFFSGGVDDELIDFFAKNGLRYLCKPASLYEIKNAVIEVLSR